MARGSQGGTRRRVGIRQGQGVRSENSPITAPCCGERSSKPAWHSPFQRHPPSSFPVKIKVLNTIPSRTGYGKVLGGF